MRALHLALLGAFPASLADGRAIHVPRRKARALLAYLAVRPGEPQPREKLIALLWADAFASDMAAIRAGRQRVLAAANLIVPGHGAPFAPGSDTPR